jgi:uncharacterized protein
MSRILFLLAAAFVVYYLLRSLRRPPRPEAPAVKEEDMVACARCGVNLPRSEALEKGGEFYCCAAHRDSGR